MCRDLQAASLFPEKRSIRSPPTETAPAVGESRPPMMFRSVLLPEPEGPMRARNPPFARLRSSPSRTWISSAPRLKVLLTFSTRTSAPFDSLIAPAPPLHLHPPGPRKLLPRRAPRLRLPPERAPLLRPHPPPPPPRASRLAPRLRRRPRPDPRLFAER